VGEHIWVVGPYKKESRSEERQGYWVGEYV